MAAIKLKKTLETSNIKVKKSKMRSPSKSYKSYIEVADSRIEESQRRYATAYQRAATFLAR